MAAALNPAMQGGVAARGRAPPGGALRRLAGLGIVVAVHLALVYALVAGLAQRTVVVAHAPIETRILPPDQPTLPPPAPPPKLAPPPPLYVPPPTVHLAPPPPAPGRAVTAVTTVKPPEPAPVAVAPAPPAATAAPPHVPVRVQPRIDMAHSREPEYPPMSRRLGEQGSLVVQVRVEPDGRPSDVKLIESSGSARLDAAALAGIRADYRFVPATVDGQPVAEWITFRFVWKLK